MSWFPESSVVSIERLLTASLEIGLSAHVLLSLNRFNDFHFGKRIRSLGRLGKSKQATTVDFTRGVNPNRSTAAFNSLNELRLEHRS
jgi:hypothetical protein